ncbi:MAG: hypothetical protein HOO96_38645 [Polyangiaceae bacterium]|nr:hypothetical protein [Polyangiaceae bacterium]
MGKLQTLKRDTVRQIIGTIDYSAKLSCDHPTRITKEQLQRPGRIWCNLCDDDAEHAKASPKGPRQDVVRHYQDKEGYWEDLACGHRREASHNPPKPGQRRHCLEAEKPA